MVTTVKNREYLRNPLKRLIHDEAPHVMYLCDIDAALLRLASGILRIVECKHRREKVRDSQQHILAILAQLVGIGVKAGIIKPGSGVFVARYDEGDHTVGIQQIGTDLIREISLSEFLNVWACCYKEALPPG